MQIWSIGKTMAHHSFPPNQQQRWGRANVQPLGRGFFYSSQLLVLKVYSFGHVMVVAFWAKPCQGEL